MSKVFIASLVKYKYSKEVHEIVESSKAPRDESRGIDSAIMGRRRDQVTPARRNSGPGGAGPVGVVVVSRIRSL